MTAKRVRIFSALALGAILVLAAGLLYRSFSKPASLAYTGGTLTLISSGDQVKVGAPPGGYPEFDLPSLDAERQREAAESESETAAISGERENDELTRFSAGVEEDPMLLDEWFWAQRAYPAGKIPMDVHDAAIHSELQRAARSPEAAAATSWTNLGPAPLHDITYSGQSQQNASGRAPAIAVNPSNANTILVGAAQGGIWKTTNGGTSFTAVSENMPSLAIKVIRYAPSNASIVYAGTGEPHGSTSIYGQGLLKSIDGGRYLAGAAAQWLRLGFPLRHHLRAAGSSYGPQHAVCHHGGYPYLDRLRSIRPRHPKPGFLNRSTAARPGPFSKPLRSTPARSLPARATSVLWI